MRIRSILRAALPATVALTIIALPAIAVPSDVASVTVSPTTIEWSPNAEYAGFQLVVSGPDGVIQRSFEGAERPMLSLATLEVVSDGLYTWELRAAPVLAASAKAALSQGSDSPRRGTDAAPPAAGGVPTVMSGTFRVLDGTIVQPGAVERPARLSPERAAAGTGSASAPLTAATAGVVLTTSDGVIRNSLCVGFDCPNSPSFGADTIRLQENNLRIHFEDTSVGSFPTADWRLEANSNLSGGGNYFAIQDADNGSNLLVVTDGAPANALNISSSGRVGLRTATPVLDLHIASGNTPAIRLEQTNASGFAPQTWDIAGNETNFFVRDATNGSKLPFRIQPNAPSNSIFVAASGNLGVGTSAPATALHVERGSTGSAQIRVKDTAGDAILSMMELQNAGEARFAIEDTSAANRRWEMRTTGDNFQFTRSNAPAADMLITQAGNMTIRGTLTTSGPTCNTPCDGVFADDYELPTIEEHAAAMRASGFLPAVGPTIPKAPFDLVEKTGGILHELEKAHIYIEQLHQRMVDKEGALEELRSANLDLARTNQGLAERLARLEARLGGDE